MQPETPMSVVPSDSHEPPPEPDDADAEPGKKKKWREAREFLWKAVNTLPEDSKTVILLRQQMDLSFVEIADRMHQSPDDVQMLWGRAILMLGKKLREKD